MGPWEPEFHRVLTLGIELEGHEVSLFLETYLNPCNCWSYN